jgi:hypothetical protein
MIFKKDNVKLGALIGLVAPLLGILLFKFYKFSVFSFKEIFQFMALEPGHKTLSVALSLSLLLNALFFTLYVNSGRDKTAKGIFITTLVYGLSVLLLKTFG